MNKLTEVSGFSKRGSKGCQFRLRRPGGQKTVLHWFWGLNCAHVQSLISQYRLVTILTAGFFCRVVGDCLQITTDVEQAWCDKNWRNCSNLVFYLLCVVATVRKLTDGPSGRKYEEPRKINQKLLLATDLGLPEIHSETTVFPLRALQPNKELAKTILAVVPPGTVTQCTLRS